MSNLRDLFHNIANVLNKISILSGVARDSLETEIKKEIDKKQFIDIFRNIESYVQEIDLDLTKIREYVYKKIDVDNEIP